MAFPLLENNLILFVSDLAQSSSYSNIKQHLAALRFFSVVHGYVTTKCNQLYLVLRGIKRSQGLKFKRPKRLPMTPSLLHTIKFNLFQSSYKYEDKCMMWAAMSIAFFGLLRVSEYTCEKVNYFLPETTLCVDDVSCGNNWATINVKASKTDVFRVGVKIRLAANFTNLCPVQALLQYLQNRPSQGGPFFIFTNGRYLRRIDVSNCMKVMSGIGANLSSHSFRIGAATTLANSGHPRWLIQALGRWSSDCFRDYIRIADGTIGEVSRSLVNQSATTLAFDPDLL